MILFILLQMNKRRYRETRSLPQATAGLNPGSLGADHMLIATVIFCISFLTFFLYHRMTFPFYPEHSLVNPPPSTFSDHPSFNKLVFSPISIFILWSRWLPGHCQNLPTLQSPVQCLACPQAWPWLLTCRDSSSSCSNSTSSLLLYSVPV